MSSWKRSFSILAALALVAAGCGDDDDGGGATGTSTTAEDAPGTTAAEGEAQAVTIVGTDYEFTEAPDELSAGVVDLSFENEGEVRHEVALVEIGDTSLEQLLEDFPPVLEGGPLPAYAENVAAPIDIAGGESADVTFTVAEGTYALICALDGDAEAAATSTTAESGIGEGEAEEPSGPPHFARGMAQTLTVGPGDPDAELPEADGTITAVDHGFETDIEAGDSTVTFLNTGPDEIHFASVSVFPEGTDVAAAEEAFKALLQSGEDAPPPEGVPLPEDVGFSGVFSAGLGSNFELAEGRQFESGRTYLLACFIQDRSGGPPHAVAYDMYEAFTVG